MKGKRGPGRPKLSQGQRVLRAVDRGAKTGPEIAQRARVPRTNVHPLLNTARRKGYVVGGVAELRLTAEGARWAGLSPQGRRARSPES